jgi:hypothetical protein
VGGSGEFAEDSGVRLAPGGCAEARECASLLILRALSPGSALGSSHAAIAPAGREMDRSPDSAEKESEREDCEQVRLTSQSIACSIVTKCSLRMSAMAGMQTLAECAQT